MRSDKASYLPHVDGMRAIAVLSVVAYHAWPAAAPGGFIGVDVFFVISGFVITRMLAREIDEGRFDYLAFLVRRIRRLLPAAAVCFVAIGALAGFVLLPDAFEEFGRSLTAASLIYANFHFHARTGYFSAPAPEQPLLHTWSLAVEDQFYLIWPLLLAVLLAARQRKAAPWVVAGLLIISLAHAEMTLSKDSDYAFYMLAPRGWELMTGALVALANPPAFSKPWAYHALGLGGVALIAASIALINSQSKFPGLNAAPACLGAAFIILSGRRETPLRRLLSSRPFVFVGLISYSLYLWHWPLFALARYQFGRELHHGERIGVIALSFGAAFVSWRYVETRLRRPRTSAGANRVRVASIGVALAVVLAASGLVIRELDGAPGRFAGDVGAMLADMRGGNPLRQSCDGHALAFKNDEQCNFGRKKGADESYDIALLGDSNADHFTPLIADWAVDENLAGRQVTESMCGPIIGVHRIGLSRITLEACEAYQRTIIDFVKRNSGLKRVILSANWPSYNGPLATNQLIGDGVFPNPASADIEAHVQNVIEWFVGRNIDVLIIGRIPHYDVLPIRCFSQALKDEQNLRRCGAPREDATRGLDKMNTIFKTLARGRDRVDFVHLTDILCDAQICLPYKDGVFVYRDGGHLSAAGARALRSYLEIPDLAAPGDTRRPGDAPSNK